MANRVEMARQEREGTGKRASVVSQMRGVDPNHDLNLKWLMKSGVEKAYYPGYTHESDFKHETWGSTTDRRREIADNAINTVLGGAKSMDTHIVRPENNLSYRERAIVFEESLMRDASLHEPDHGFRIPDVSTWAEATDFFAPGMTNEQRAALTSSSVYMTINFAAENMRAMKKDNDWDEETFFTWLHGHVGVSSHIAREAHDKYLLLVYRIDEGGRYFVMWVLPASPRARGKYLKSAALLFFPCSCQTLKK